LAQAIHIFPEIKTVVFFYWEKSTNLFIFLFYSFVQGIEGTPGVPVSNRRIISGDGNGDGDPAFSGEGEIVSTQTVSSKTRTVETITV
jgi:hypothetical protein